MSDKRPPRNEHELEIALVRLMRGDNGKMLSMRSMMANAIVGESMSSVELIVLKNHVYLFNRQFIAGAILSV